MKVIVKNPFNDKYDNSRSYAPGTVLEWEDPERIQDCIDRGLIEPFDGNGIPEQEDQETGHLAREGLEDMKVEDLKKLAADMGIDTAPLKKKAELIEAICAQEVIPGEYAYKE
ncbi:MAG: Rho termination factor N-terminal domain-containing protein [Bacteroidales bacterium]|nr:Rho termination factor N-terminal domain-containing protein [Acidaminococcaceae bacterium]MBR5014515.1 Rho termination factor N-terminal domain-containing protein [Bacteroidales bacterium]